MSNQGGSASSSDESFSIKAILPLLLAIASGMFVVMLDSTIMNVAVPKLVQHFQTDLKSIQWAITGYTLALSAVIPLAGWFSDRFTAKRTFLISLVLFVFGSILCTFAQTTLQLIIFRVIQGLGGGMVGPIGMAMSFQVAPPEKRGSVMGILGLPMLIAPILGPLLSGYFIQYVSWHWIFLINLPIGAIAFFMCYRYLPARRTQQNVKLDKTGMILAPIAFAGLVYGIHEGGASGWGGTHVVVSLMVGTISLLVFIWVELHKEQPLLELRAFRSSYFMRGSILAWVNQMALFGSLLLIPLYLQQVKGFTPLAAGLFVIPQAVLSSIGLNIGGRLADKHGARPVVIAGVIALACSLFALTFVEVTTSSAFLIAIVCCFGLGQGLSMMQISTYVMKAAPKQFMSRITPITASTQQIFTAFSITILTAYLSSQTEGITSEQDLAALSHAFGHTFYIPFGLSLVALILSLFLSKPKPN